MCFEALGIVEHGPVSPLDPFEFPPNVDRQSPYLGLK
jgi:hypothetical protein